MELATARDWLAAAEQALAIYRSDVLEPVRVNRRLLERAREAGRLDLPTTLLLQRQLLESELAFWDAWLEERSARAELLAASGGGPRR